MSKLLFLTMVIMNNVCNPAHKLLTKQNRAKRKGMALIKFGGGVVGMSGSIAGNTYARNRYGSYARARTKPVNPNSAAQQAIRSTMSTARDAWFNTLTAAQRTAWAVYAANVSVKNRLGEDIYLTGFNMFIRSAMSALYNGLTITAAGPSVYALAEQDESVAVTTTSGTNAVSVAYNDALDWCDEDNAALLVYESKPQNPTVNFFAGPYKLLGKVEGDSTTPPTSPEAFTSNNTLTAGQKVFYQFRILRGDGRLSDPFRTVSVVG